MFKLKPYLQNFQQAMMFTHLVRSGDQRNFLIGLPRAVITQGKSHLRHDFAMASSIGYVIFNLH
ncbi:hypothetical protein [Nostoc sp.]|uniref:hypothetical protein n=1 Tax=Nostoc sp. TaxID=1180 RepID=UPI002FF46F89